MALLRSLVLAGVGFVLFGALMGAVASGRVGPSGAAGVGAVFRFIGACGLLGLWYLHRIVRGGLHSFRGVEP